ncbi:MAG: hypothetical protein R2932_60470 [Caldilineaceae bacterium]
MARAERRSFTPTGFVVKPCWTNVRELPLFNLDHLHRMTDDTGMIQHANFIVPNYDEGQHRRQRPGFDCVYASGGIGIRQRATLARRPVTLAFIGYAFNGENGQFPGNFMNYQRSWLEESGLMTVTAVPCGP